MNREDIIRMAQEAGLWEIRHSVEMAIGGVGELERFAALVRKDYSTIHANLWLDRIHKFVLEEREACAKVCDEYDVAEDVNSCDTAEGIAIAIRARGNHD